MDGRLISLNEAVDAMMKLQTEDIEAYGASIPEGFDGDRAVMALKALPSAQPGWIPVTERLPEYGTTVLTCNHDGEYEINHIIDEEDGEWFWNGAVAWMPLPTPYREGRQNDG